MRKSPPRLTAAVLALALLPILLLSVLALSGHDEETAAPAAGKIQTREAPAEMTAAGPRLGIGWRRVTDARNVRSLLSSRICGRLLVSSGSA